MEGEELYQRLLSIETHAQWELEAIQADQDSLDGEPLDECDDGKPVEPLDGKPGDDEWGYDWDDWSWDDAWGWINNATGARWDSIAGTVPAEVPAPDAERAPPPAASGAAPAEALGTAAEPATAKSATAEPAEALGTAAEPATARSATAEPAAALATVPPAAPTTAPPAATAAATVKINTSTHKNENARLERLMELLGCSGHI